MMPLSDVDRLKALLEIASLAIAAEAASLDRRYEQSDVNTILHESGKSPSRRKLQKLTKVERRRQNELRAAIYAYGKAVDANAAVRAGIEPEAVDNRGQNAQMLADHLP